MYPVDLLKVRLSWDFPLMSPFSLSRSPLSTLLDNSLTVDLPRH